MPVRAALGASPETLQDQVLAAEERYWDAYELAVAGRPVAALYLAGFAAETLLKTAGFRFDGARPADQVDAMLAPARRFGKTHFAHVRDEGYHSLDFWLSFLVAKRGSAGRPLTAALSAALNGCVARAHSLWAVGLRYRSAGSPPGLGGLIETNLLAFLEDVDWLRKHHSQLWT